MKIDWKRKLTSRKFWVGVAGAITGLVIFFTRHDKSSPEAITSLVMTIGSGVAYIIGEGLADKGSGDTFNSEYYSIDKGDADNDTVDGC